MKRRSRYVPGQLQGRVSPRTGHHCSDTGWWQPVGRPLDARLIQEGEVMPALLGIQVHWEPAEDQNSDYGSSPSPLTSEHVRGERRQRNSFSP